MSILRHPAPSAALNKNRENVYMGPNLVNSGDRLALSSKQNTFVPLVLLRPSAKGHGAAEDGAVGHGLDGDAEVALELLRHAVHVQEQRHVPERVGITHKSISQKERRPNCQYSSLIFQSFGRVYRQSSGLFHFLRADGKGKGERRKDTLRTRWPRRTR